MFALAAFCRALPRKLACSFPPLHSQALMRALAFTLHLPSPLSPTPMVSFHMVSAVHVSRHSSILFSSFLSFLSSSASLCFLSAGLPACPGLYLLHPPNLTPTPFLMSSSSYLPFHPAFPYSSASPPLSFHPVSQKFFSEAL